MKNKLNITLESDSQFSLLLMMGISYGIFSKHNLSIELNFQNDKTKSHLYFVKFSDFLESEKATQKFYCGGILENTINEINLKNYEIYFEQKLILKPEIIQEKNITIITNMMFNSIIEKQSLDKACIIIFKNHIPKKVALDFIYAYNELVQFISMLTILDIKKYIEEVCICDQKLEEILYNSTYEIAQKVTLKKYKEVKQLVNVNNEIKYSKQFIC